VYTISEDLGLGWVITNTTVDAVSQGAVSSVNATVPNGGDRVVRFYNSQRGSINVHKEAQIRHNGADSAAPNDDDGWTITVDSVDCNVHLVGQTDANGNVSFPNLPSCDDYVVAEVGPNAASPGFVQVSPAGAFTNESPVGQTLTFLNRRTTFDPPCQNCTNTTPTPSTTPTTPTATPTTPTTTSTATPPTSTASPTNPPASPSVPVTNIAGERTPGTTPIAPDTGSGGFGQGGSSLNIVLLLAGLVAITSGLGALALGRRR
jgi:hypothetical protein